MPLKPGSSKSVVSSNISEFHGGKTYNATKAKFGKKKADAQAVAVAMSNARKYGKKFADGGEVDPLIRPPRNPARMPQEVEDVAKDMTVQPVMDAVRAIKGKMTEEEAQNFAVGAAMGLLPMRRALPGIKAYHGSPHDFNKFDMSKIGTGEGAQAYGHGLYFAENPKVAEAYKKDVSMNMMRHGENWTPVQEEAASRFYASGQDHALAMKDLGERIKKAQMYGDSPESTQQLIAAHELLKSGWMPPAGKMYEVNINAHPDQFLDWDKPLTKEKWEKVSPAIRDRVDEVMDYRGMNPMGNELEAYTGKHLYQALKHHDVHEELPAIIGESDWYKGDTTPERHTSAYLRDVGIPGIKYLDQGSRPLSPKLAEVEANLKDTQTRLEDAKARGHDTSRLEKEIAVWEQSKKQLSEEFKSTHNYAVFNDKIIDILKKYGVTSIAALPPAVQASLGLLEDEGKMKKASGGSAMQRARGYAAGGFTPPKVPWVQRRAAAGMRGVTLHSNVPGRTDKLPMKVPSGSYILPSDIVSGLGQGNTQAGSKKIMDMVHSGALKAPKKIPGPAKLQRMPYKMKMAQGGEAKDVDIIAAGGEHVLTPDEVATIGHGDVDHGHRFLDKWVVEQRKKNIRTLRGLKPPVRD